MIIDKKDSRYSYLRRSGDTSRKRSNESITDTRVIEERGREMRRLWRYRQLWDNGSAYRSRRWRNKEYLNGNQWGDKVEVRKVGADGLPTKSTEWITEAENIRRRGKVPLKNNVIVSVVNSILGVFRQSYGKPEVISRTRDNQSIGEMNTCMAEYIYQINSMKEVDAKDMLEAIMGGLAVQLTDYQWNRATRRNEEVVVSINPTRVFMNSGIEDPRGSDITTIGVLQDMTIDVVLQRFAKTREQSLKIREIYKHATRESLSGAYATFVTPASMNMDFFVPQNMDMCRVIQAWEQESEECWLVHDYMAEDDDERLRLYPLSDGAAIDRAIRERESYIELEGLDYERCKIVKEYFNDIYWHVRYLSPFGDILYESRTPFSHEQHPFAVYMGHLIDGEIHSFVEQIIDQQRYINRLITLIDFIMGSSAKGVLVFPENAMPKGMNKEDILEQWTSFDGVIFANLKPGMALPQQIATNATNIGAQELLSLQLSLVQEVSGVHGALQGKEAKSGTAASLYAQEANNSQVNIADLLEGFVSFRKQRDYKLLKIAPQCYDEEFYINLAGREHSEDAKVWRPAVAARADIYINLEENNNQASYRMLANQILIKAMEMRLIDFETVLDAGGIPNADKIRSAIERRKAELRQEQLQAQQDAAQAQALQMQGQAMGQRMLENGASEGEVLQAGAEAGLRAAGMEGFSQSNNGIDDEEVMSMIGEALGE